MSDQPLVSIIIPTYNRAHLIGETLDSVLAQTYTNWECIIVDDGSSDNTDEFVSKYVKKDSRFKYYHRPEEHLPGGNGARNYGFKMSQGEYIQWFDSDDLMEAEKLELKVKAMLVNEVDFVVCENAEIKSLTPYLINKKWLIISKGDILLNHLKTNIAFTTAGPLFDKQFFKDKLLFDEQVKIGQEWEFYSRLLTYNPKVGYVFKVLYHFRNIESGIRGKIDNDKYLNRCHTEKKLFKFINSSGYFKKNTRDHYDYQQFKLYWSMRRFHYLRHNFSCTQALSYMLKNLKLIDSKYLIINSSKAIVKPNFFKKIINKA
jgi:glycosyltransferase involved in cell wall biosynthesis